MWIAGRLRGTQPEETAQGECGTVTIGGSAAGVLTRGEERDLPTAAPGGYAWRPRGGERVLVLKCGTRGEERCVALSLDAAAKQTGLADGEICLYSAGGASVCLRNDGRVEITGRLFLNGKELTLPEEDEDGA